MGSSTSSSHKGWERDSQLCASVSPSAKHGEAGAGGLGCWFGAEGAALGSCGMAALQTPHHCLLGGIAASLLHPWGNRIRLRFHFRMKSFQPFPLGKMKFPALSSSGGMERGWRLSRERPSASSPSRVPAHSPEHRSADRFTCSPHLARGGCTKGGPTATNAPFLLPGRTCAKPLLPQFPQQGEQLCVCPPKMFWGGHLAPTPPAAPSVPSPAVISGAAHSCPGQWLPPARVPGDPHACPTPPVALPAVSTAGAALLPRGAQVQLRAPCAAQGSSTKLSLGTG